MPPVIKAKLALAVLGLLLFAAGVRWEHEGLRWAAIAAIGAAFLLRFFGRRHDDAEPPDQEP